MGARTISSADLVSSEPLKLGRSTVLTDMISNLL